MRSSQSNHLPMLSLETLTFTIRTGLPILVELINLVNSAIIFLHQWPYPDGQLSYSDCDSHSPALLDLFLPSDTSICSTMAFPPLGNSDHIVSVWIDFPSNSQWDAPFHCIAYNYSCAGRSGLSDHLRWSMGGYL